MHLQQISCYYSNTQMSKMTLASCLILPAVLVLALVLLSVSNTRHCWSIMPCCVDILVVLLPLVHRSLLQVLQVTIPEVSSFFVKCSQTLDHFCRDDISLQCITCSSSAHLCSVAACVCDVMAKLQVGYVCLQWQRSPGRIDSGIVKGFFLAIPKNHLTQNRFPKETG